MHRHRSQGSLCICTSQMAVALSILLISRAPTARVHLGSWWQWKGTDGQGPINRASEAGWVGTHFLPVTARSPALLDVVVLSGSVAALWGPSVTANFSKGRESTSVLQTDTHTNTCTAVRALPLGRGRGARRLISCHMSGTPGDGRDGDRWGLQVRQAVSSSTHRSAAAQFRVHVIVHNMATL